MYHKFQVIVGDPLHVSQISSYCRGSLACITNFELLKGIPCMYHTFRVIVGDPLHVSHISSYCRGSLACITNFELL